MLHVPSRTPRLALSAAAVMLLLATALPVSLFAPATVLGDATWVVTSLADDGSEGTLRYAIDNSEDGDIVRFGDAEFVFTKVF